MAAYPSGVVLLLLDCVIYCLQYILLYRVPLFHLNDVLIPLSYCLVYEAAAVGFYLRSLFSFI